MPIKAKFGSIDLKNVHGYRISMCFVPKRGFDGNFYVYVLERIDARTERIPTQEMGKDNEGPVGDLRIFGIERDYTFPEINLINCEMGVTRREKFRILEFVYRQDKTDTDKQVEIQIKNDVKDELPQSALADDYKFGLDDGAEHLLGFDARFTPTESTCLRFVALRNKNNSFVKKIIETNKEQLSSADLTMPQFKVQLTPANGQSLDVTSANLERVYVDESFGEMLEYPVGELTKMAAAKDPATIMGLTRIVPKFYSPLGYYQHEESTNFVAAPSGATVETASFVFKPKTFHDMNLK